ncbi:unnamed protein product [Lactuca saligna]|uniref:PB1 domain-containing protein n=1 Tax=Lactuca saligna TaxID=75948 RepID=A0AA35VJ73_LACSI|nr:unnamed protein product [Lactuca saligna]
MATVIKIKFGDTLRRIYEEDLLDFDMDMLREKICILFGLDLDADFTLTYIDEDGDIVTLCDDNDLDDLAAQSLNPLRMTVTLNPKSSLTSTQDQLQINSLNSAVSLILKFVPERQHNALLKLLLDVAWENIMGDQQGLKIEEASDALLPCKDGSSYSNNEALQVETVKKDGVLENVHLNVIPYSESKTVKGSDAASSHDDNAKLRKSVDFETCVNLNECPFIGMPLSNDSIVHSCPCGTCVSPLKKGYIDSKGLGTLTIHEDITCNGCGVCPIIGPRFISKSNIIVDLCCTCFEKTGHDAADYVRMDLSPTSFFSDKSPVVCNDKLDPEVEVVNTNMDQDNEVCEKKPIGIVSSSNSVAVPSKLVQLEPIGSNQGFS